MTGQPQESTPSDAPVAAVAVVLRTRNRPQLLPRALASIGAQTFRDFRVIVVNDGGDEGPVLEQVAACPAVRGQVDVVTNPQSVGREAAMNTGVTHSRSEFLVIHDDDDTWHPEFLAATVGHLQDSTDAAVAVRTEVVYEELTPEGVVEIRREILAADKSAITLGEVLRANISPPISVLYRRSVHDEVGLYDGTLPVLADWDFMLRLLSVHTVGFVDGPPLAYWATASSSPATTTRATSGSSATATCAPPWPPRVASASGSTSPPSRSASTPWRSVATNTWIGVSGRSKGGSWPASRRPTGSS